MLFQEFRYALSIARHAQTGRAKSRLTRGSSRAIRRAIRYRSCRRLVAVIMVVLVRVIVIVVVIMLVRVVVVVFNCASLRSRGTFS